MDTPIPSFDFQVNAAWLTAAMIASILLAWFKLLALDGDLAKAEPKTLRYRVLHTAPRLVRGGAAPPPKNPGDLAVVRCDHRRVAAYRRAAATPLTSAKPSLRARKQTRDPWNPRPSGPTAGPLSYAGTQSRARKAVPAPPSASHQP